MSVETLKILFRVDGHQRIGLGHLTRCHALAQTLITLEHEQTREVKIGFMVSADTVPFCHEFKAANIDIYALPENLTIHDELHFLYLLVNDHKFKGIVLDGYHFSTEYRKSLRTTGCFLACFDDINSNDSLHTDMVINGALNANQLDYDSTANDAILCLGHRYRVLRHEFCNLPQIDICDRAYLTIVLGGSDPTKLTLPILHLLQTMRFDGNINVITGQAFTELATLNRFLEDTSLLIEHHHNCQEIAQQFNRSRLVISAAGGTQFELQATGTPSLLIVVADNQLGATQQAEMQGWCYGFDARKQLNFDLLKAKILALWDDTSSLETMCKVAYESADTLGATRVAKLMVDRINVE